MGRYSRKKTSIKGTKDNGTICNTAHLPAQGSNGMKTGKTSMESGGERTMIRVVTITIGLFIVTLLLLGTLYYQIIVKGCLGFPCLNG